MMENGMKRMMTTAVALTVLVGLAALPGAAKAQTVNLQSTTGVDSDGPFGAAPVGKHAGAFEVSLGAVGVIPETSSSSIRPIGGQVNALASVSPELTLTYFLTDNISLQLIAASTEHRISAGNTALGHVDVGTAWVLPPTLTVQYNFMPHRRFSPYLGLGVTVAFFYGTNPSGPTIQKFSLSTAAGPTLDVGFDYDLSGPWFANFDVKQMFFQTTADIASAVGPVTAKTWLNPTVVGASLGYRF
jgi:outer membrane protein